MNYQTIIYRDGSTVDGLFPTDEWALTIQRVLPHKDKRILDVGCCTGMYSILALSSGEALSVEAIDIERKSISLFTDLVQHYQFGDKVKTFLGRAEDYQIGKYDIVYLHMVLHWIDDPIGFLQRIKSSTCAVSVIYREANPHYSIPANGHYFPTQTELNMVMEPFTNIHHETLMVQGDSQAINLAIYKLD